MKSSRLGRTFDALLGRMAEEAPQEKKILEIPVGDIHPNPNQPRENFDQQALSELVDSIARNGILQPIIVREDSEGYQLIAGERRWRAAREAGLATVPAIARLASDKESLELALIENLQRRDLNPIEEAKAYKELIERFALTQDEAAARVGKKRSSVANMLRLLDLPADIQRVVSRGTLSMGHARALLGVQDRAQQRRLAARIQHEELSVRQTERLVGDLLKRKRAKPKDHAPKPPHILDLEGKLRAALGTRVTILEGKPDRGKVLIEYFSEDDFHRILEQLLGPDATEALPTPE